MTPQAHIEKHFTSPEIVRDIVIGMADGLTVPFALAAGLSGAVSATRIVVIAGLAEIVAGAIAMGLGGYLAARSDADHYSSELRREWKEVREKPAIEALEVTEIFSSYGLSAQEIQPILDSLRRQPERWVDFMMKFELGLEKPDPGRALKSALTIGASYVVGGLIPLSPYIWVDQAKSALRLSVVLTLLALVTFGYIKGKFTGINRWRSSLQTAGVGALAAAAAYLLAILLNF